MTAARLATQTRPQMAASGLPIDPRMRARLIEVRRDQHRRRRRVGLAVAASVAVVAAGLGATRSPLLVVRHVEVSGAIHTSRAELLMATGLDRRRQMLDVSPGWVVGRLDGLPWVGQATIRRRWPSSITIVIVERAPVAQMPGPAGQAVLVDAGGRVLATGAEAAQVLATAGSPLPQLAAPTTAGVAGSVIDHDAEGALALTVGLRNALAAVSPDRRSGVLKTVSAAPDGSLRATLTSGVTVVFGSADQLAAKLVALRTVLAQVNMAGVATIDVRVPDTPVLTKANGGSMVSTTPRG